jgi:AcrR family transcriptional regulator
MAPRNPGVEDPRVRRSRAAILEAALDELAERGYGAFTMDGVATRAGVARSTVYRLWRERTSLVADAMESLNVQPPAPSGAEPADPRERIRELLLHLAHAMSDSRMSACLPAIIDGAERDPALRELHHGYAARRRSALVAALARARDAGAVGEHVDPEQASLALAGAVFYRRLMTDRPLGTDEVDVLMESVLGPS